MIKSKESEAHRASRFVATLGAHDRRLYAFILSLVPNYADAEDLAQQVRLALWEQFDSYDCDKDFGKWARTIAYYKILAYRKRGGRQHAMLSDAVLESLADVAVYQAEKADDYYQAMLGCLRQLKEAKRKLLMRYYSGKETMRELAEQTGRSFHAVRHSIARTRAALADCISKAVQG